MFKRLHFEKKIVEDLLGTSQHLKAQNGSISSQSRVSDTRVLKNDKNEERERQIKQTDFVKN